MFLIGAMMITTQATNTLRKELMQSTRQITGGGTVVSTSITDATASTVLEITNTRNVPLTCFFAALPTDGSAPQEVMIAPNATETYLAAALGYSAKAARFNIVNNAMNVGSYRIAWQ